MEVRLDKRYPVAARLEQCWAVLGDVRAVAACMPGAQITEQLDDTHFKGTVKSKVGPAVMSFNGDIELQGRDETRKSLSLLGKGADKAGSSASMQLTAHLEKAADGDDTSVLVGAATVVVSGKLAQFGSRLLVPVSDAMLAQFADNFRAAAAAAPVAGAAPTGPVDVGAGAVSNAGAGAGAGAGATPTGSQPGAAGAEAGIAAPATPLHTPAARPAPPATQSSDAAAATAPRPSPPPPAPAPASPAAPAPVKELNALALMWTVLKDLVAGVFRRKP